MSRWYLSFCNLVTLNWIYAIQSVPIKCQDWSCNKKECMTSPVIWLAHCRILNHRWFCHFDHSLNRKIVQSEVLSIGDSTIIDKAKSVNSAITLGSSVDGVLAKLVTIPALPGIGIGSFANLCKTKSNNTTYSAINILCIIIAANPIAIVTDLRTCHKVVS